MVQIVLSQITHERRLDPGTPMSSSHALIPLCLEVFHRSRRG